jgi:hypothetical protein
VSGDIVFYLRREAQTAIDCGVGDGWPYTQAADKIEQLEADLAAERAEIKRLMEGMELALGLIANGQYWDRTDGRKYGEWNEARLKWRDEHWRPALDRNKEASRD